MKLSQAVKGFLLARSADGYSENTTALYQWALDLLAGFLEDPKIQEIAAKDLQNFMLWLRTDYRPRRPSGSPAPLAPASVENVWIAVRSFFNWAEAEFDLVDRPDANLKRPRYKPRQIQPLTEEEITKLLQAAQKTGRAATRGRKPFEMTRPTAKRDTALILLLLDTGLRVSEAGRLTTGDIDLETGAVQVQPHGTGRKTEPRTVYIGKSCRRALWRYLAERGEDIPGVAPLFLTLNHRPMDRNSIRQVISRLGKRAGIKGVHPHRLRHTFAVQYLKNGGNVFELQELLGHSSLEMVKHYAKLAEVDIQAAHRKASPVDNWRL